MERPAQAASLAPEWSALQQEVLAAMQVELYVRRAPPAVLAGAALSGSWNVADSASRLASAVARAAGIADVAQFGFAYAPLPDLSLLRRDPAAKRALWRSLRSFRSLATRA